MAERHDARIIVSGILFWYPLAGVTFQFLHYLLGLRALGYEVFYVEDSGRWIYDPRLNDLSPDASSNVTAVAAILERYGFSGHWAFRGHYAGGECYGMSDSQLDRLYGEADALLNVTGAQELRDEHMAISRRIYVESDPFLTQVRAFNGDEATIQALHDHHVLFTFGENVGRTDCTVPTLGAAWLPTRQPVHLELWDNRLDGMGDAYTTITTWHNTSKDIDYLGERYFWTKDREFLRFADLPRHRDVTFELSVVPDEDGARLLDGNGWQRRSSVELSADLDAYRDYIRASRGEFTVARDQYVRPRTGWFSDRSACYLAAGRPVITQETGFSRVLPTGRGLFAFSTMDEILAAIDAIESDPVAHGRAAREIAAEYFAAERVLGSLMARAGL